MTKLGVSELRNP